MSIRLRALTALIAALLPALSGVAAARPLPASAQHHARHHHVRHLHLRQHHHHGIPQHNSGDHDSDNSGGPSDGDGNL